MHLSKRLPGDLSDSPFFSQLSKLKRSVQGYTDLTVSSPLRTGQAFDLNSVLPQTLEKFSTWNPDACGWEEARKAVAKYYADRGGNFDAEDIQLTASTSEAYSILFKTL